MSVDLHHLAGFVMARADVMAAEGRTAVAAGLYLHAAKLEAQAFGMIPELRRKTRGIVAVSAVGLFLRAGESAEAIHHANRFLTDPRLPRPEQDRLIELRREAEAVEASTGMDGAKEGQGED